MSQYSEQEQRNIDAANTRKTAASPRAPPAPRTQPSLAADWGEG